MRVNANAVLRSWTLLAAFGGSYAPDIMYNTLDSRTCIGSRDPYCVWDTQDNVCIFNTFQAVQNSDTTIDSTRYKQNIHSGEDHSINCAGTCDE